MKYPFQGISAAESSKVYGQTNNWQTAWWVRIGISLGKVNNNHRRGTNWRRPKTGEGRTQCLFGIQLSVYFLITRSYLEFLHYSATMSLLPNLTLNEQRTHMSQDTPQNDTKTPNPQIGKSKGDMHVGVRQNQQKQRERLWTTSKFDQGVSGHD